MVTQEQDNRHLEILEWARIFGANKHQIMHPSTVKEVLDFYEKNLKCYFALCGLSRHKTAREDYKKEAYDLVFSVRVNLERLIIAALFDPCLKNEAVFEELFQGSFFGKSKKQGISLRMPLVSCIPTELCAGACYAHDAMDAMPNSVTRGAVNGVIAKIYETGTQKIRSKVIHKLEKKIQYAVSCAVKEVECLENGWSRKPFIRFSHVGELAAFPQFANNLAYQVKKISSNNVTCVLYTRHPKSVELDPSLWVINFTLDPSTSDKAKEHIPKNARIVFSAFDGEVSADAEINFLEHHPWHHIAPKGAGTICPTTLPSATDRTCDGVKCDRCFVPKN